MTKHDEGKIVIKGARTHNLKNINLELPRGKLVVFTGLSGSGKSSLAFDTIFAEGQRRYVESLSAYARQFLLQMQKPDVDEITGLSPAISIDQKTRSGNPRSTVATITEIYDYLRVLYARVGKPHCLTCGRLIEKLSPTEIVTLIGNKIATARRSENKSNSVLILAPLIRGRKGEHYQLLYDLLDKGYREVMVNGARKLLRERIILEKNKKHEISAIVDELSLKTEIKSRLARLDSRLDSIDPRQTARLAEAVEKALELADGLVGVKIGEDSFIMSARFACPHDGFSYPEIEPRLFSFNSPYGACPACRGLGTKHLFGDDLCPVCAGARLRGEALGVTIADLNLAQLVGLSIAEAQKFINQAKLSDRDREVAKVILKEIEHRLQFLLDVGLDYLTLDRRAHTLSGGESQRIRLASQLGSRLVGALYVLDEPTIGLHPRDNDRLIKTLKEIRDLGNTIIVVEHDEDTIFSSDYLVDIGPGAGVHGGSIVAAGETEKFLTAKNNHFGSLTIDYLRGDKVIAIPAIRRTADQGAIKIRGGKIFNITDINATVPLGRLVAVTGVSGSGKSSFVYEILHKNLQGRFDRRYRTNEIYNCREFAGTEYVSRTILIDQSPIGRTPRSNPATYTGAFTWIRDLFAATEEARVRGWQANRFSFNVPTSSAGGRGGRCEACQGNGTIAVEMHFLPTVYVECDVCRGRRFDKETLEVVYKKKNIYQVLQMTVEEALKFFTDIPAIADRLKTLSEVGLGYLELGQSATTLSGGEAQRVKISSELYRPMSQRTIYLLDEPTVGLHYEDVRHLIAILQKLVDRGNTVVVIEHNMEVIKNADWVIDLGPEGGTRGGQVVAQGTPEQVASVAVSHTGEYLKRVLKRK
ncbi:MAG: excinuclease ABC subunit UvrA [Patescibacteria group bacterium]